MERNGINSDGTPLPPSPFPLPPSPFPIHTPTLAHHHQSQSNTHSQPQGKMPRRPGLSFFSSLSPDGCGALVLVVWAEASIPMIVGRAYRYVPYRRTGFYSRSLGASCFFGGGNASCGDCNGWVLSVVVVGWRGGEVWLHVGGFQMIWQIGSYAAGRFYMGWRR